ncbi:phytanoyl-CoA dioxygenase family protein [Terriglobus sp.]|uniref:phytanoyl-CoA dioxygenase family protein n=1 Tax=Terriglobus sp. TaxID=1889013 RepID=UPI003AFFB40B
MTTETETLSTSSAASPAIQAELDAPFTLTEAQVAFYAEHGYIKLKHVLSPALLEHYRRAIHDRVAELSRDALPMEQRDTYGKAFLQIMNLWTESPEVREFVFGKRLARIAAELMGATGVRVYHDQALYKEAGGGITPWHADQYYWPVDSDRTVTVWVPLQATPKEMGPLIFSEKSHRLQVGRDLEISDESEMTLKQALETFTVENSAYDLGDVSFHAGWTFHRAGANSTDRPREVMTVIYMDENIRLTDPKNKNHVADMERWMPGLKSGDVLNSRLNPVLYSSSPGPVTAAEIA